MTDFVGLILAAGEGKRFGQPKAGFEYEGERLIDRAVRIMLEAGSVEVFNVLGAWTEPVPNSISIINPNWKSGMGSSLQVGLNYLFENTRFERAVISLVDLPGLTAPAISRIGNDANAITAAVYNGERGHPVAFNRNLWSAVANNVNGDRGARDYLVENTSLVSYVEVGDIATIDDLDFPI